MHYLHSSDCSAVESLLLPLRCAKVHFALSPADADLWMFNGAPFTLRQHQQHQKCSCCSNLKSCLRLWAIECLFA